MKINNDNELANNKHYYKCIIIIIVIKVEELAKYSLQYVTSYQQHDKLTRKIPIAKNERERNGVNNSVEFRNNHGQTAVRK